MNVLHGSVFWTIMYCCGDVIMNSHLIVILVSEDMPQLKNILILIISEKIAIRV